MVKGNIRVIEELSDAIEPNQNIILLRECVKKALEMMVQLSSIPEDELFKICLDFWHFIAVDITNHPRGQGTP